MTTAIAEVRSFPEEKFAYTILRALREVESAGCSALYGPEFAIERIQDPTNPKLRPWHQVLTGIYFGTTKFGTPVVIGVHRPHYLTNPDNIEAAIKHGLLNGAAATPEVAGEIPRLLEMEGDGVSVVDYRQWEEARSGVMPLENSLTHPAANLILGGRARTEEYIERYHRTMVNGDEISVWKLNDFSEIPVARLGMVGGFDSNAIDVGISLDYFGRFAGGKSTGAATRIRALEELFGKGTDVGNGLTVIRNDMLSPNAYGLLHQKRTH